MADETDFITVFRSGDPTAERDAAAARERLVKAGIRTVMLNDEAPGVVEGSWEVRVPAEDRERAERLVDALVSVTEPEDDVEVSKEGASHDLDFVNVATFDGIGGEMQATLLKTALEASDIPTAVIGLAQIPSLSFEVRVPKTRLEEAMALIAGFDANQSIGELEGSGE